VTIGGAVLQNELQRRIPSGFQAAVPADTALAYATIPLIETLPEPLRTEVRIAFANSLKVVWKVFVGISGVGLLSSLLMRSMPLHTAIDEDWALAQTGDKKNEVHDDNVLN
jgi:hypothetical protein